MTKRKICCTDAFLILQLPNLSIELPAEIRSFLEHVQLLRETYNTSPDYLQRTTNIGDMKDYSFD
jgi:hypothetical protein